MTLEKVSVRRESADGARLVLGREDRGRISLTDFRGLVGITTRRAKQIADVLVRQQLVLLVEETLFEVRDALRHQSAQATEQVTPQVTPHVAPQVTGEATGEVTGEARRLLAVMAGEMKRAEIQQALGLRHEDHFRDAYLGPALEASVIEMTIPDKHRSSKQRYRLTERGRAVLQISDV